MKKEKTDKQEQNHSERPNINILTLQLRKDTLSQQVSTDKKDQQETDYIHTNLLQINIHIYI